MDSLGRSSSLRLGIAFAGDLFLGIAALYAAFWVRIHFPVPGTTGLMPGEKIAFFGEAWGTALLARAPILYLLGFYDPPRPRPRIELLRGLLIFAAFEGLLLVGFFFLTRQTFPRSVLLLFLAFDVLLLLPWRILLQLGSHPRRRRVALVGCGAASRELAEQIELHHWHGLTFVGFVSTPEEVVDSADLPGRLLGSVEDLPRLEGQERLDDIILADETPGWKTRILDRLAVRAPNRPSLLLLPGPLESLTGTMRYRWVRDIPLIDVVNRQEQSRYRPAKRLFDLLVGGLLLVVCLPVLGLCAVVVRLTSPGSALYRQTRVGRDRRPFTLLKLRTMQHDAEAPDEEVLAAPDDPRLTAIGPFLRRFRLDELPQLFNVLGGSMSLVGPRPERPGFVERYLAEIPGYGERFTLRPGITGLAQVNGDYYSSPQNKLRYDLAYRANASLWLDLSILFRTVKTLLATSGFEPTPRVDPPSVAGRNALSEAAPRPEDR